MSSLFRLVDPIGELVIVGDSIGYMKGMLGDLRPGSYQVDELSAEPHPSGHTARRWGMLFKLSDGTIIEEPDPWE
jgi:hypothetical protein